MSLAPFPARSIGSRANPRCESATSDLPASPGHPFYARLCDIRHSVDRAENAFLIFLEIEPPDR